MSLKSRSVEHIYLVADQKHSPSLISFKSKFITKTIARKESLSSYIDSETDSKKLLKHFLTQLPLGYADPLKIYFHNMSRVDTTLLLEQLSEAKEKPAVLLRANRIYFLKYKNMEFLDSYLKAPYSLATLTNMFNISYTEGPQEVKAL